jgi:hypothetical protein
MAELPLVFEISGNDITEYIEHKGIHFTRNDVDSPESGEMADGTIRRDRIIIRRSISVKIKDVPALTTSEIAFIQALIRPEYIQIKFTDPYTNTIMTRQFYSNNVPANAAFEENGVCYWTGFTFPIVETGVAGENS